MMYRFVLTNSSSWVWFVLLVLRYCRLRSSLVLVTSCRKHTCMCQCCVKGVGQTVHVDELFTRSPSEGGFKQAASGIV